MADTPPEHKANNSERGEMQPRDRIVYLVEESKTGSSYQAVCPELDITSFGDTAEAAKDALRKQVAGYIEDLDELGDLDEVLIEAGFYFTGELWMSNEVEPAREPDIKFF